MEGSAPSLPWREWAALGSIGQNAGSDNSTLVVNGTLTGTQINVGAAGNTGNLLKGTGTVAGPVTVAGGSTIAPGNSIGTLGVGSLSLTSPSSKFSLEINFGVNPTADLLNVTGSISLNSFTLDLSLSNLTGLTDPATFLFAANNLIDPVTGNFATITGAPNGFTATIDYAFSGTDALGRIGTGNDLAITFAPVSAVPEPGTTLFGLALLGAAAARRRRTSVARPPTGQAGSRIVRTCSGGLRPSHISAGGGGGSDRTECRATSPSEFGDGHRPPLQHDWPPVRGSPVRRSFAAVIAEKTSCRKSCASCFTAADTSVSSPLSAVTAA